MSGGELWTFPIPEVYRLMVGLIIDQAGEMIDRPVRASDVVVVDMNVKTGRVWVEPAPVGTP